MTSQYLVSEVRLALSPLNCTHPPPDEIADMGTLAEGPLIADRGAFEPESE